MWGRDLLMLTNRGNIQVFLFNHSDEEYFVKRGDNVSQVICEVIIYPEIKQVFELDITARLAQGFGSSGV